MSGGHYDYKCFQISQFAEELRHDIETNHDGENAPHFQSETLAVLEECQKIIEKSGMLAREIEWLYSGDHGEDSFLRCIQAVLRPSQNG